MYFHYQANQVSTTKFDSELGWAPIPNKKSPLSLYFNFQLNSLGFRSPEIDNSKKHILLLGDSVAWGHKNNEEETFSYYLSQKFSSYQIINMAVLGYGVGQSYLFLKRHIEKVNPKLIIFMIHTGNDLYDTGSNIALGKNKPIFVPKNTEVKLLTDQISRFSCINLIHGSYILRKSFLDSFKNKLCDKKFLNLNQARGVITALFHKINALGLKKNNAKTLFIISPSRNDLKIEICKHNPTLDYCQAFQKLLFPKLKKFPGPSFFQTKGFESINLKPLGLSSPLNVESIKRLDWGGLIMFQNILSSSRLNYIDYSYELAKTKLIQEKTSDLYLDNSHYSPQGSKQFANNVANWLRKNSWIIN